MLVESDIKRAIKRFTSRHSANGNDNDQIMMVHLMASCGVDASAAMDCSSTGNNDNGIDAWFYEEKTSSLKIFQSKNSQSKQLVIDGIADLRRAISWLLEAMSRQTMTKKQSNPALRTLLKFLASNVEIRHLELILVSPFERVELEPNIGYFVGDLLSSGQVRALREQRNIVCEFRYEQYNLREVAPRFPKKYPVKKIKETRLELGSGTRCCMEIAYVPLHTLVDLFRDRGENLFEKNVRLSLTHTKQGRVRVVSPMKETLKEICAGKKPPETFTFNHIGVTISGDAGNSDEETTSLEAIQIINGCQTVHIADEFLTHLEKQVSENAHRADELEAFRRIKVLAKIMVGLDDSQLKEVTNANNRQNPIAQWQLFSNDSIHREIEDHLSERHIAYERQLGRFEATRRDKSLVSSSENSRKAISMENLGQTICLCRNDLNWAAKPALIFDSPKNHDRVFNRTVFEHLYMVPLLFNVMNACKSGIREYTDTTKRTQRYSGLLKRPIIMHHIYRLGIKYYLHNYGYDAEQEFSQRIYRSPPRDLLEIFASEFPKKFLFECFTKISKLDEKTSDDERAPELHRKKTQAKREAIFEGVERDLKLQKVTLPFN